jgi:uncharacterized protein (DUF305 family)
MTMRSTTTRRSVLVAAGLAALAPVIGLSGCTTHPSSMPMDHGDAPRSAPATPSATGSPATGPHNRSDVMFAQMMIPHHQQAIEMSDLLLAKTAIDPEVSGLARQIKAAQSPEITQMAGWLAGWGQPAMPSTGHQMGGGMGGMMSQEDLDALERATGTEAMTLYLSGMITHHEGAIGMAQQQLDGGENPDAKELARQIVTSQRAEISTMQQLLANL